MEVTDIPLEGDLDLTEPRTFDVMDLGSNIGPGFLPDRKTKVLIREEYLAVWKCIEEDRGTLGRQFGGMVVTGQLVIGTYPPFLGILHGAYQNHRKKLLVVLLNPKKKSIGRGAHSLPNQQE